MALGKFSDIIPPPGKARAAAVVSAPAEESGETYHLTAEQLAELNQKGTTTCDEGCTITADIGGGDPAEETSEAEMPS